MCYIAIVGLPLLSRTEVDQHNVLGFSECVSYQGLQQSSGKAPCHDQAEPAAMPGQETVSRHQ